MEQKDYKLIFRWLKVLENYVHSQEEKRLDFDLVEYFLNIVMLNIC